MSNLEKLINALLGTCAFWLYVKLCYNVAKEARRKA